MCYCKLSSDRWPKPASKALTSAASVHINPVRSCRFEKLRALQGEIQASRFARFDSQFEQVKESLDSIQYALSASLPHRLRIFPLVCTGSQETSCSTAKTFAETVETV